MSHRRSQRSLPLMPVIAAALPLLLAWQTGCTRPTAPTAASPESPSRLSAAVPASRAPSDPSDPRPALAAALEHTDPRQRAQEFGRLLAQWIARDIEGALAYVRQMRRGPEYSHAVLQVLGTLGIRDPERALELARELISTREERAFYSGLFDRLARENIATAIERLALVPAGEGRENAIRALVDVWTRADSAAALAWAQQLPNSTDRIVAIESVLHELAQRDPVEAIALAQKSLSSPALERTIGRALQRLTATDPAGASKLVGLLPPGDLQTMSAIEVARALALQNIDAALAWARTLRVDVAQWLAINNVLSIWAQKDSAAVARYVNAMPPGPGLDFIARHAASLLCNQNPREAILWAETLPTDSARSAALIAIASTWAQRAPAEAVRWAASLQDEPLRTDALTGAHSYWMLLDTPAARAWLDTADLSPAVKSRLLRIREVQF